MWYYTQNNQQFGPVDEAKIKELIASGAIGASTMVWSAGMPNWLPITQTPLSGLVANLPPAPPPPPPSMYYAPAKVIDPREKKWNDLFQWFWIGLAAFAGLAVISFILGIIGTATFAPALAIISTILFSLATIPALAAVTLFFIFIYKAWQLVQDGEARTTPDPAVAYCFIPGWQFYWIFVAFKGLAKELNRVMAKENVACEPVKEDTALWFCIMILASPLVITVIPLIVFWIMYASQIKKAAVALSLAR
jgi:hypothetical protein